MTADRPPEWIDQQDGQAIRQQNLYGRHVKKSCQLPVEAAHPDARWHINRLINEAINLSQSEPAGPVHINVPFREPFYPEAGQKYEPQKSRPRLITEQVINAAAYQFTEEMQTTWQNSRKLIVIGQSRGFESLLLRNPLTAHQIPVVADLISNSRDKTSITAHDIFLKKELEIAATTTATTAAPDLLITWGKSILSKPVKLFLRKHKPAHHWHIQPAGQVADVYQSLTRIIRCQPTGFLQAVRELPTTVSDKQKTFYDYWQQQNEAAQTHLKKYYNQPDLPFSEGEAVLAVLDKMPAEAKLHLANSMTVRYANLWDGKHTQVFANRGTSGIDGSKLYSRGYGHHKPSKDGLAAHRRPGFLL